MNPVLPPPTVRILVCGNADRGDDGVALATVATLLPVLPRDLLAKLEVRRCEELRVEDLSDLPPGVSCLIIDAVAGIEGGTIVRLPLSAIEDRPAFTPRSSHQLPIGLVIGLAGVLRDCPIEGTFVGLAGRGFGYGTRMSRVVRAAMPDFRETIIAELDELASHPAPPAHPAALRPASGLEA